MMGGNLCGGPITGIPLCSPELKIFLMCLMIGKSRTSVEFWEQVMACVLAYRLVVWISG